MTSQVETDKYQGLLREKGGRGFPYLVFMDAEGEVTAKQGERTVAAFQATLSALSAVADLQKKATAGDKVATVDLLLAEMTLGRLDLAAAKARAEKALALGALDGERKQKLDGALIGLEVEDLMAGARTREAAAEMAEKCLAMLKEGRVPTGRVARTFYLQAMSAAEKVNDAKTYETALGAVEKMMAGQQGAEAMLKRFRETLEKLKAGDGGK
ncbi:MAG: hypothetical protein IPK26_07180 [Planctomycetes bacterium]|nr:hypothetical protein [Planctomycetota bacterium]